jgi:hypothetical protein
MIATEAVGRIRLEDMRRHIEQLTANLEVSRFRVKRLNQAKVLTTDSGEPLELWLPAIRSKLSYATALHEIGHLRGRYQSRRYGVLVRERWAWQWARENALIWTDAMERNAVASLDWYEARAAARSPSFRIRLGR